MKQSMSNTAAESALTLVLDTNVVLDWLVFNDPLVQIVPHGLAQQRLRLLTSDAALAELQRVLTLSGTVA